MSSPSDDLGRVTVTDRVVSERVMTDGEIADYIAGVRKWKTLPTDYDAVTEDIMRRLLTGELTIPAPDSGSTEKP